MLVQSSKLGQAVRCLEKRDTYEWNDRVIFSWYIYGNDGLLREEKKTYEKLGLTLTTQLVRLSLIHSAYLSVSASQLLRNLSHQQLTDGRTDGLLYNDRAC